MPGREVVLENAYLLEWLVRELGCLYLLQRLAGSGYLTTASQRTREKRESACEPRPFLVLHCDITPSFLSLGRGWSQVLCASQSQSPFWFGLSESHPRNWNQLLYSFLAPNENLIIWMHFAQKYGFCLKFLKMKTWQNCIFYLTQNDHINKP